MSRLWMIAYDIRDNRTRYRVANLLKNHGLRVQYSIFECYLTSRQQKTLRAGISVLLEREESVRWYPLCRWCKTHICWQGIGRSTANPNFFQI